MVNEKIMEIFREYSEKGISAFPCRRQLEEKTQLFTGKMPAITGWNEFCDEQPTDEQINSWAGLNNVWGVAIACGEASNICCIDIDTQDPDLQKKLLEEIPYTPVVVKGDPRRSGKYIYRLTDSPASYTAPVDLKVKIPCPINPRKSAVDIFFGNSYICVPPSLHTGTKKGENHFYSWENDNYDLLKVPIEELPVLSPLIVEKLRMIVSGMTRTQIDLNMGGIDLSGVSETQDGGRWLDMKNLAGGLIKSKVAFEKAITLLLERDEERNGSDPYFMEQSKGHRTISPRLNAYKFYAEMLVTANKRHKSVYKLELPRIANAVPTVISADGWEEIKPFGKYHEMSEFDTNLIPKPFRTMVMDASKANGIPPQMLFMYMIGTFSTCLGNKVLVNPYKNDKNFVKASNFYIGIVAKSGERKTQITGIALNPLLKIERERQSEMRDIKKQGAQVNEDIEIRVAKITKNIKQEIEENGLEGEIIRQWREEIENLRKGKVEVKEISLHETNATVEKLYEVCEQNPNGIFREFNEFGSTYKSLQRREAASEREFLMNGWDGTSKFSYKTKHQGSNQIDMLCLSSGFSIQDSLLTNILVDLQKDSYGDDGLMPRFCLIRSDGIERETKDHSYTITEDIYEIYRNAYDIEPSEERLKFESAALEEWMDYQRYIKNKQIKANNTVIESFLSKYVGTVVSLASIIAHIDNNGMRAGVVRLEHYRNAEKIMKYVEETMYSLFSESEEKDLKEIVEAMKITTIEDEMTVRDLQRKHQTLLGKTTKEVKDKLYKLHKRNYIRLIGNGKNSYSIKINPVLLGE